jgi:hypothetical protein
MAMKPPRQRRAGLVLAGIATLGWAAALALAWFNASLRSQHQTDLRQLDAARKTLGVEIDPQRQATGALPEPLTLPPLLKPEPPPASPLEPGGAELRKPRPSDSDRAKGSSMDAPLGGPRPESSPIERNSATSGPAAAQQQEGLAKLQRELQSAKERLASTERASDEASRRLREKKAQIEEAEHKLSAARQAAAALEPANAAREKDAAERRRAADAATEPASPQPQRGGEVGPAAGAANPARPSGAGAAAPTRRPPSEARQAAAPPSGARPVDTRQSAAARAPKPSSHARAVAPRARDEDGASVGESRTGKASTGRDLAPRETRLPQHHRAKLEGATASSDRTGHRLAPAKRRTAMIERRLAPANKALRARAAALSKAKKRQAREGNSAEGWMMAPADPFCPWF